MDLCWVDFVIGLVQQGVGGWGAGVGLPLWGFLSLFLSLSLKLSIWVVGGLTLEDCEDWEGWVGWLGCDGDVMIPPGPTKFLWLA